MVADTEEMEKIDASETYPRRINAKEVLTPQKGEHCIFPIAHGATKLSGRDHEFREPALRQEQPVGSARRTGWFLDQQKDKMTLKPEMTFGQSKVTDLSSSH